LFAVAKFASVTFRFHDTCSFTGRPHVADKEMCFDRCTAGNEPEPACDRLSAADRRLSGWGPFFRHHRSSFPDRKSPDASLHGRRRSGRPASRARRIAGTERAKHHHRSGSLFLRVVTRNVAPTNFITANKRDCCSCMSRLRSYKIVSQKMLNEQNTAQRS
jgi:hypothetical protein